MTTRAGDVTALKETPIIWICKFFSGFFYQNISSGLDLLYFMRPQIPEIPTTKEKDLEACLAVNSPEEFTHFTADTAFDLLSVGWTCCLGGQPSRHCGQRLEAVMGVT